MASLYDIPVETITGESTSLREYKGRVLLVVNVASQCGLTTQYDALEKLYLRYKDRGFVVVGFPANDFGGQEPGSNKEIAEFCKTKFGHFTLALLLSHQKPARGRATVLCLVLFRLHRAMHSEQLFQGFLKLRERQGIRSVRLGVRGIVVNFHKDAVDTYRHRSA